MRRRGEQRRGGASLRLERGQRLAGRRHLLVEARNHAASGVVLIQRVGQLLPAQTKQKICKEIFFVSLFGDDKNTHLDSKKYGRVSVPG